MPIRDQKVNRSWINSEVNIPYYQILPGSASRDGSLAYQNSNTSLYIWKENKWNRIFSAGDITFSNSLGGGATLVNNSPQIGPNFVLKNIYFRDLLVPTNGPNTIEFDCTALDSVPTRNWKAGTNSTVGTMDNVVIGDAATNNGPGQNVVLGSATQCTTAQNSIVIGKGASSQTSDSISIGPETVAYDSCISVGASVSTLSKGVSIGHNSQTTDQDSVVVGYESSGVLGSVAIGYKAQSLSECVALGKNAISQGSFSVAVGTGSNSIGFSVSIGHGSIATSNSTAIGYQSSVTDIRSVSINASSVSSYDTVALGYNSNAFNASKSVAIGSGILFSNSVTGNTAIGCNSHVSQSNSTALGAEAECSGPSSVAIGVASTTLAGATFATTVGSGSTASNSSLTILGTGITSNATNATMIGNSDSYVVNSSGFYKSANQYCINTKAPFDTPSTIFPWNIFSVYLNLINFDFATNSLDFIPPYYVLAPEPNQMYILSINFYVKISNTTDVEFNVVIDQFPSPGAILSSSYAAVAVYSSNYVPFSCTLLVKTENITNTVFGVFVWIPKYSTPEIYATQVSLVRVA